MTAVFGEDGTTIDSGTAAALLAATCSGGDPTIANNIAQLLMPEIGAEIDQAMMGALMAACSLINAGANTEEVSFASFNSILFASFLHPVLWLIMTLWQKTDFSLGLETGFRKNFRMLGADFNKIVDSIKKNTTA